IFLDREGSTKRAGQVCMRRVCRSACGDRGDLEKNLVRSSIDAQKAIALLEVAYDETGSDEDWRRAALGSALAIVGAKSGGWFDFETDTDGEGAFRLRSLEMRSARGPNICRVADPSASWATTPPVVLQQLFGRSLATTFRSLIGDREPSEIDAWQSTWRAPVIDNLGIIARDLVGKGVLLVSGTTTRLECTPRELRLLDRVAFHFGAALRLRGTPPSRRMESAEAVLSPSGKILHAHEAAKNKRSQLDDGRRRREHARASTRDPAQALDVWKGLVAGRWSLVDHFDTDGKRFLLALKNTPKVDRRADLTPRERRVCALASLGHRDKEIAYMLGLTVSSITASLHRARTKLHVKNRIELVRAWRVGSIPQD
ncbi:MAG: helix-turn-helix transcriptional regulator, partial [Polyangiaceae bacterium]